MFEILSWKRTEWDFVGRRRTAFVASGLLCCLGIVAIIQIARGVAPLGTDFAGGLSMNVALKEELDVDDIRKALASAGVNDARIMEIKADRGQRLLIKLGEPGQESTVVDALWSLVGEERRTEEVGALEEKGSGEGREGATTPVTALPPEAIAAEASKKALIVEGVQEVGPAVGKQLQRKAAWAVLWAVILIMVYIWIRFEYRFGVAAAAAMAHDVLAVLGIMFLLQKDFTLLTLTALLTLAGYSLTDTVVLFDRIRENLRIRRNEGLASIVNASINEILSRSVVTSVTTMLPLIALLVYGSQVTFDFALALTLGILIGTYSSWFVASPLIVEWESARRRRAEQAAISGPLRR